MLLLRLLELLAELGLGELSMQCPACWHRIRCFDELSWWLCIHLTHVILLRYSLRLLNLWLSWLRIELLRLIVHRNRLCNWSICSYMLVLLVEMARSRLTSINRFLLGLLQDLIQCLEDLLLDELLLILALNHLLVQLHGRCSLLLHFHLICFYLECLGTDSMI